MVSLSHCLSAIVLNYEQFHETKFHILTKIKNRNNLQHNGIKFTSFFISLIIIICFILFQLIMRNSFLWQMKLIRCQLQYNFWWWQMKSIKIQFSKKWFERLAQWFMIFMLSFVFFIIFYRYSFKRWLDWLTICSLFPYKQWHD